MSSPSFGAMSPFMDRVHKLSQFVQHPLDSIGSMMHSPESAPMPTHDQAIQQMNQQANAHANDAANASFVHPAKIEDQKRPLKTK